ncbi:MAG: tripartite tricarboxylate transporter substrate-binding protein [Beijerinckiaceae bacterium]
MKKGSFAAAFAALTLAAGAAHAQTYPNQTITVIVPYAPGGNTDVVGRLVTEQMSNVLGEKMVIENVAGAGGTTGSLRAARAKPDGYTLLVGQMGTHAASVGLYPNLQYNPVADFEHIGQLSDTPIGILVRKDFPAKDLKGFIGMVKAAPEKYNNGHGGVGSTSHVSCLLFTSLIGARSPMVAYRGSGPAFNDLLSSQYDFLCDQIPHTVEHVKAGTVRMLAIGIPERSDALPDVPTTIQAGLPEFQASGWNALFAPKGTPAPIVAKLNDALRKALDDPGTKGKLEAIGAIPPRAENRTPDGLKKFVQSEVDKWVPIMKAANVEVGK